MKLRDASLQRAFELVESNGARPMRALAANVMGLMGADATLAELVKAYQNADGGWHRFDSDMPAPLSTISAMYLLKTVAPPATYAQ